MSEPIPLKRNWNRYWSNYLSLFKYSDAKPDDWEDGMWIGDRVCLFGEDNRDGYHCTNVYGVIVVDEHMNGLPVFLLDREQPDDPWWLEPGEYYDIIELARQNWEFCLEERGIS
jgi:hypothetical protein